MPKKELENKDLNQVSGGIVVIEPTGSVDDDMTCPNCGGLMVFNEKTGKYHCQNCSGTSTKSKSQTLVVHND